jgi:dockerin type I repeat protein
LGTQYLFDWTFELTNDGELLWNGDVGWAGGRYEQTTITSARLVPVDADFDDDGNVDGADFLTWQRGLGATGASPAQGDANGDGDVNGNDLATWQRLAGTTANSITAVPEPVTATLFTLALTLLPRCRHWQTASKIFVEIGPRGLG